MASSRCRIKLRLRSDALVRNSDRLDSQVDEIFGPHLLVLPCPASSWEEILDIRLVRLAQENVACREGRS